MSTKTGEKASLTGGSGLAEGDKFSLEPEKLRPSDVIIVEPLRGDFLTDPSTEFILSGVEWARDDKVQQGIS